MKTFLLLGNCFFNLNTLIELKIKFYDFNQNRIALSQVKNNY